MSDVTRILNAIERGDARATDRLLPLVYEELRLLAAQKLYHEPAGQTLASGSADNTIRLWDANTGEPRATLTGYTGGIRSVAFSPDGQTLALGSWDNTIRLWDADTGTTLATLAGHTGGVRSVAFSPDGQILASGSDDGTIRLWDINAELKRAR